MERVSPAASRTVLLVDDDPVSLEILSILLGAEGYRVRTASSGHQALTILSPATATVPDAIVPDLVFLDMQMPGLSGTDLLRAVRHLCRRPVRILGMSASQPARSALTEFDGFLLKPITVEHLNATLSRASLEASSAAGRDGNVLDRRVIEKLRAILPPDAIREIYLTYVSDTRMRIQELERCAGMHDNDGLRRCAHMIKGAAAMAGVTGIASIASALEAGAIPAENQGSLFHSLRSACDDVEQTLIRHVRL
jgi:CheY-like chemotaxis protein